ncbi:oxygen-independent coproporphyrinogen-3 oxidase [Desulfuromusa kysingii]|uniref:Heme chaperone HemW n=1 Tax=Desulfuromusa kysingii TaxID=37625 RepID=A0A1H4E149_9BACT|nr:radical SAM family heme chaperone HemW [Desulfuromusa kysingii]SEA78132.1 oxygen-independent coproporphyrinogen-3 oxidase [Desulfuromusa kysingii]
MGALYLHIPFCISKCPYCDFFSEVGQQQQIDDYVEQLKRNIKIASTQDSQPLSLDTLFFGGGTPSLLSVNQLADVLRCIVRYFGINPAAEITIEANPGTLSLEKLKGYRQAGVNRLSLGIQSLDDHRLQQLGRIHTVAQARESIISARAAGFDNLSLDLMFALPNQDLLALESEIAELLTFKPEHVSVYGLSYEEGTDFFLRQQAGKIRSCDEGLYADMYLLLHNYLVAAGYNHYEISNFAKPDSLCRHNQVYWKRENCLAIGAGAHGFQDQHWGKRWHVEADLNHYKECLIQGKDPVKLLEQYDRDGAMKEYAYLRLRTSKGIDVQEFYRRFGLEFQDVFAPAILKTKDYLYASGQRRFFDVNGWLIYDHLISNFI